MRVVLGGTFDPVHIGHLAMATELAEVLEVDKIALMPCYQAVHKGAVAASPQQRLAMLKLAIKGNSSLVLDEREITRQAASYTFDSLQEIRQEVGSQPLVLAMGTDAAAQLPTWRCAELFADYCHIVVVQRPGEVSGADLSALTTLGFSVAASIAGLRQQSAGRVIALSLRQLDISSSDVRYRLQHGKSVRYLLTGAVASYICDNSLYTN